jgi:glycosyltransferase involved in cell wall biosynthesis
MNCFGVPVARLAGTPIVLSSQRGSRMLNPPLYNRMLRVTDRLVDAVVANCDAMRRHLVEDEGVPSERVRVCLNGLDTATFHPGPRLRAPALADASLVIGVVCVLRREKGLATLVEAFAQVRERQPGMRLAIIGTGPELGPLQQLAARLGIAGACVFLPATADVAGILDSIDIFVLPSLSEALSNSLMEAMACGCAAVASRTGGNPELIEEGETGLLFEPGNTESLVAQLTRLIDDPALRRRLSCAGSRRMAIEFSIATAVGRVERLYESLLG